MAEETLTPKPSGPLGWWNGLRHYIHEVRLEMKKVSWPTRTEVINTTMVVVLALFFFSAFLFLADLALYQLIHWLEAGAKWLFG